MDRSPTFLVVVNRCASDPTVLTKALRLARQFGARLELFLCDAEHAYALQHAYDRTGLEDARKACMVAAMEYLTHVKSAAQCDGVAISVDVACESPLYEGIVHKARKSGPVLVLKHAGSPDPFDRAAFDANDWQLMRTCPATLLLTRGRRWRPRPRFAAAVDASEQETEGLARQILKDAQALARANDGELELLYAERGHIGSAESRTREIVLEGLTREVNIAGGQVHILAGDPEAALPARN